MLGFKAATALSTFYVLAGLVTCPSPQKEIVDVSLAIHEEPYTSNAPLEWLKDTCLNNQDCILAMDEKRILDGLTEVNIDVKFEMKLQSQLNIKTHEACLSIMSVNYTITYAPQIWVASDYKNMNARYSQIIAHQKQHVAADKRIIKKYIPYMKQELEKKIKNINLENTYPESQIQAQKEYISQEITTLSRAYIKQLEDERSKEHTKIDTVDSSQYNQ